MNRLVSLACGILFGLGLALSGMVNPAKVQGFLDITGTWDPSLAGVMVGAIPTAFLLFRLAARHNVAVPPPSAKIDGKLVAGAVLFGIGWGLVGICPGPALIAWILDPYALIFIAAMALGMAVHDRLLGRAC